MIKNKRILLSFFLGILFFIVMILVLLGKIGYFDQMVYNAIISFRSDFFDFYFINITKLANTSTIVLVVLLFVIIFRNRYSLFLVISSLDSLLLTSVFKYFIQRDRPSGLKLIAQDGYSFPSGHTMISVCVYGYLLYLVMTKIKNKIVKYCVSILLILVILSIGVSRIYVGVHFASDVLAGYLLSICYLLLLIDIEVRFYLKRG